VSLYTLARPLLFSLDPETAHRFTLQLAGFLPYPSVPPCPVRALGLQFPNPVGLAAGLDKNAEHIDALAKLGFGFIEVGTVTPRAQAGNPKPRLFRLPQAQALINRLGFNNVGVDAFLQNVGRSRYRGILGINIGRNAETPPEQAVDDYEICLDKVYSYASYVTVNISSPNTRGLRDLQQQDQVENLVTRLSGRRARLAARHGKHVPLVLKVAPDLVPEQVSGIANAVRRHGIEGVIATNTSVSRDGVEGLPHADEAGGLSGKPLRDRATRVLKLLDSELRNAATLIGAGGILSGNDAEEKRAAGASLVQLYTGLIYRGPELVAECVSAFRAK
jgi:dihydroorotate dehydrogenase